MKCPLRTKVEGVKGRIEEYSFGDCLEEECAWWDAAVTRCAMLNISEKLSFLYLELNSVANKLSR